MSGKAKLSTLKPRFGGLQHRIGKAPADEAERTAQRLEANPWRAWYSTKRWRDLRLTILQRDRWTCQRTGVLLIGKHPAPNSPVVDHIKPHRGNEALFWDMNNLHAVSKAYHDSTKQAEEAKEIKGVWY